jgi:SAM-dependent methyltransferase
MHEYQLTEPLETSVSALADLRVLEINQAGNLTSTLQRLPDHKLVEYPDVGMQEMPWDDGSFDLIVHSDTLEHVPDPLQALRECERILRCGGVMCFTVPIILGRLSRSRQGLEPSYHGGGVVNSPDLLVHSEFGADTWSILLGAGFVSCTITALELPSAIAFTVHKEARRG